MYTFLTLVSLIGGLLILKAYMLLGSWLIVLSGYFAYKAYDKPHDLDGFMGWAFTGTLLVGVAALVVQLLG